MRQICQRRGDELARRARRLRTAEDQERSRSSGLTTTIRLGEVARAALAPALPGFGIMSPGGHLVTTALAGGAIWTATGSIELTAGVAVGGFLIDIDHVIDYVTVERRRRLTPAAFLRYYTAGHARRVVLALHSYELFAILALVAWRLQAAWLTGYLAGGLMHLGLDIIFNGRLTPKNIFAFYSFGYRLAHRFETETLFGSEPRAVPEGFWRTFFLGARLTRPLPHGTTGDLGRRIATSADAQP